MHVAAGGKFVRERGQLEVVRGEQRECPSLLSHVVRRGPRQRQAIEGAGAAADLVHQHQALRRGVVQDRRGLGHLDHERRAATGDVVGSTDARKDAVQWSDPEGICRHETADVGEYRDQRGLSHVRRFAAHVGAGDDYQALFVRQGQVVRDERSLDHLFDDEVTASADLDALLVAQLGLGQAQALRAFGETHQRVEFGDGECGLLQVG